MSHQLAASITAFYAHVAQSLSHRTFVERDGPCDALAVAALERALTSCSEQDVKEREALVQRIDEVLALEQSCTTEVKRFLQLSASRSVMAIGRGRRRVLTLCHSCCMQRCILASTPRQSRTRVSRHKR